MLNRSKATTDACHGNNESILNDSQELKLARFKKAKNFTAGVAFFSDNGQLDEYVLNEVQRRFENRKENKVGIAQKKKRRLIDLQSNIKVIKAFMLTKKKCKTTDLKVGQLKD